LIEKTILYNVDVAIDVIHNARYFVSSIGSDVDKGKLNKKCILKTTRATQSVAYPLP
jgi:hypothetical protein